MTDLLTDRERVLDDDLHILLTRAPQEESECEKGSPLAGVRASIKDIIVTKGLRTTAASKMLEDWIPPYDATVVQRLKAAGAIILGKTNCDAWAHGSSTENSDFGPTKNPWDPTRVPGGSSGGAAAAVAAGIGDFALGTDTGGSIRQPAAFCGVTGLKPTYGRVSRYGLIAMGSSLDTIGPLAQDAATAARVLEVIAGHDRADATSVPTRPFRAAAVTVPPSNPDRPLEGFKIGIANEYFGPGLDPEIGAVVKQAIDQLEALGASLHEVTLPETQYALAAYYIIMPAEVSSNLGRFDGIRYGYSVLPKVNSAHRSLTHSDLVAENRARGFGAEAKRRIILGTFVLSAGYVDAYYKRALRVRTKLMTEFASVFDDVDLLVTPTTPTPAFPLGAKTTDPLAMYLQDIYTVSANLLGIPALSIPCGFTHDTQLPIGLQLMGPMWSEERLLRTAHFYQQATTHHLERPPLSTENSKSQAPTTK